MSKNRNYKHFIRTLKNYDLYVTFRILTIGRIKHQGYNPNNKLRRQLKQLEIMNQFKDNNWTTKKIISFLTAVKKTMYKTNYFHVNNAL